MLRMANETHGSPFDRGSADSWYGRERKPHFYPNGTYNGRRQRRIIEALMKMRLILQQGRCGNV